MTNDFYQAMLDTSLNCGIKILSDDFCCKLLAWLCMFGGEKEATTQNNKMRTEILYAQKRLNIYGGEVVNKDLLPLLKQRMKECGIGGEPRLPEWIGEIDGRYNFKTKLGSGV